MNVENYISVDAIDAHEFAMKWMEEKFFKKIRHTLGNKGAVFFQRKMRDCDGDYYESLWHGRNIIAHYFIERDELNYSNLTLIDYSRIDKELNKITEQYKHK